MGSFRRLLVALFAASMVTGGVMLSTGNEAGEAREHAASQSPRAPKANGLAPSPPLGWNSYDSYGGEVNEQEVRANASYLAKNLSRHGWKYVVIDYYWYFLHPIRRGDQGSLEVAMDDYGRLLPVADRFPSASGARGFKPLADYVHSLGLKFGIHIMRGIPRAAVKKNLPILGTTAHAQDIADLKNTCAWSTAMYGVDVTKPAGQSYYDSIAKLYAMWGVDYIKADDMSWGENPVGENYHGPEIEALRKAMNKTGRPMVLSLSPGPTALAHADDVLRWSQLWRISNDFWDDWNQLKAHFDYCRDWAPFIGPTHWPDADMLPLGRLRIRFFNDAPRQSLFTHDEEVTLMTLWSIFRSPLMMGGDLPSLDAYTLSLLTNDEVLAVNQASSGNHELFRRGSQIAWVADGPRTREKLVGLFNLGETPAEITVSWKELRLTGKSTVRDLWRKSSVGPFDEQFAAKINPHGAGLFKIKPIK